MTLPTEVMWFRRDLRVTDHPALSAAAEGHRLLCLYVLDPRLLNSARMSPARIVYLRHALADLASSLSDLGNRLVVLTGDATSVVPQTAAEVGAVTVHISADHTPYASARDTAVQTRLQDQGMGLESHAGITIGPVGSVLNGSGSPYRVFTPFHRSWRQRKHGQPLSAPHVLPPPPQSVMGTAVSDSSLLQSPGPDIAWADGGETAARIRLGRWLDHGVTDYDDRRDIMAVDGTSRLSPDLHFGCLSAREVYTRLDRTQAGQQTFAAELVWRDFYAHVLGDWPHAAVTAFRLQYQDLPWHDDPDALTAWKQGRTGFPIVDAAMRQLLTQGWMHNRARMIVASFLCKDLLIDWRHGEAHFLRHLVDSDMASNNGGWQWAAGTGTDAQPFFRIFNPLTQSTRLPPMGTEPRPAGGLRRAHRGGLPGADRGPRRRPRSCVGVVQHAQSLNLTLYLSLRVTRERREVQARTWCTVTKVCNEGLHITDCPVDIDPVMRRVIRADVIDTALQQRLGAGEVAALGVGVPDGQLGHPLEERPVLLRGDRALPCPFEELMGLKEALLAKQVRCCVDGLIDSGAHVLGFHPVGQFVLGIAG